MARFAHVCCLHWKAKTIVGFVVSKYCRNRAIRKRYYDTVLYVVPGTPSIIVLIVIKISYAYNSVSSNRALRITSYQL